MFLLKIEGRGGIPYLCTPVLPRGQILSTFPFSRLSNDLPVARQVGLFAAPVKTGIPKPFWGTCSFGTPDSGGFRWFCGFRDPALNPLFVAVGSRQSRDVHRFQESSSRDHPNS